MILPSASVNRVVLFGQPVLSLRAMASRRIGFTLVEMLAVIAIIGFSTALAVPSLPSLLGTKGISKAVNDTSGILELARTEAMARKTYVWVSFLNRDVSGTSELLIGTSPANL